MHPQDTLAPQPEQESIFTTVFAGRVRFGGRRLKKVVNFFGTPDKILATRMVAVLE